MIVLPYETIEARWQHALAVDSLELWRSFAFLLSAEAKMAQIEGHHEIESDLLTLFEVALQHVYSMYPKEVAA